MWEFMVKTAEGFWTGVEEVYEALWVIFTWVIMMCPIIVLVFVATMLIQFIKFKVEEHIEERKKKNG